MRESQSEHTNWCRELLKSVKAHGDWSFGRRLRVRSNGSLVLYRESGGVDSDAAASSRGCLTFSGNNSESAGSD